MQAWDDYLKALEPDLGKETIDRWARCLKILNFDAANLYLEAPDSFQAQWFNEYLLPKARKSFLNENGRLVKIHMQVAQKRPLSKADKEKTDRPPAFQFITDPIDQSHTFEALVETLQNKIVFKLFSDFKSFKKTEPPIYNPIYIYGVEGIGKTHLLHATATLLKVQKAKVQYVKSLTFTQNMVSAIKSGKMPEFRDFYRDCDVLIVDDIHHLAHKSATQEEFFHTFNSLHMDGKQIILSSHLSPQQLKDIEPRLISRFEWGIVLPLQVPAPQELKKILNKKLSEVNVTLSSESKDFLIQKFSKNPKILSQAISALILRAHLKLPQGQNIDPDKLTPEAIERLLADLIKKEQKAKVTVERIIDLIVLYFGVEIDDILSKSQSRECVLPRQMSMFFCREYLKLPYMKIGRIFSRDHSTVMSSVKQIQQNIKHPDNDSSKLVTALKQRIFPHF